MYINMYIFTSERLTFVRALRSAQTEEVTTAKLKSIRFNTSALTIAKLIPRRKCYRKIERDIFIFRYRHYIFRLPQQ
jgi:hypothetical protein